MHALAPSPRGVICTGRRRRGALRPTARGRTRGAGAGGRRNVATGEAARSQIADAGGPSGLVERHLDRRYLVDCLTRLTRVPTDVPLGYETLIEPDDPKLVHYVQEVVRPELVRLGIYDLLDAPRNNLVACYGT